MGINVKTKKTKTTPTSYIYVDVGGNLLVLNRFL